MVERTTARVVLLDPADRVLLLHGYDPRTPTLTWWYTPGGGMEPGETLHECALREVVEETGIRDLRIGPLMWRRRADYPFAGRRYHSDEWFYLARTTVTETDTSGWTELERYSNTGLAWWTIPQVRETVETVYPADLGGLLAGVLSDGPPETPISLPAQGDGRPPGRESQ